MALSILECQFYKVNPIGYIYLDMFTPILIGSELDKPHAKKIAEWLKKFHIPHEIRIISAHKVPEVLVKYIAKMNQEKEVVYVTIAGRSNGLSGVTAGSSIHPVIACPPFKDKADYLVNIHSSLQMPSDTPVLTLLEPQNAALAIARIFALNNKKLEKEMKKRIKEVKKNFH